VLRPCCPVAGLPGHFKHSPTLLNLVNPVNPVQYKSRVCSRGFSYAEVMSGSDRHSPSWRPVLRCAAEPRTRACCFPRASGSGPRGTCLRCFGLLPAASVGKIREGRDCWSGTMARASLTLRPARRYSAAFLPDQQSGRLKCGRSPLLDLARSKSVGSVPEALTGKRCSE
jgi:hypothetical protein